MKNPFKKLLKSRKTKQHKIDIPDSTIETIDIDLSTYIFSDEWERFKAAVIDGTFLGNIVPDPFNLDYCDATIDAAILKERSKIEAWNIHHKQLNKRHLLPQIDAYLARLDNKDVELSSFDAELDAMLESLGERVGDTNV